MCKEKWKKGNIKFAYLNYAKQEIGDYLELTENETLNTVEKLKLINDVFDFSQRYLRMEDGHILPCSLQKVQKVFRKGFEVHNLQIKLLELLLYVIEKQLQITSPPLRQTCEIKQDLPLLRPDALLMSRLQAKIYDLIENEHHIAAFLDDPEQHHAVIILWLILKEGIYPINDIKALLNRKCLTYRIKQHWFFDTNKQRYWLSPKAELLLTAYWQKSVALPKNITSSINRLFHQHRLIPVRYALKLPDLYAMAKNEFILKVSPVEYSICHMTLPTTSLSQDSLYRIITGQRVANRIQSSEAPHQTMPIRQKSAWLSACSNSAPKLRKKTEVSQQEVTTAEQIKLIERFTSPLVKTSLKQSVKINSALQNEIREWLETNNIAKAVPWAWVLLAWLYHLLRFGGKHKKRLRLKTIKDYVSYVAKPFIREFSGCEPKAMDNLDWAEKLNIVVEQITPTKKGFVLYFAEFLIESELVPNLCLSDIDIPSIGHNVNANLITQHEADKIIQECDNIDTPISKLAKWCFCFGFYSGLRRGEIAGLQFSDFAIANIHYVNLQVRPNKYRELKSSEGSRNLPLDSLWPDTLLNDFIDYLTTAKTKFTQHKSLIFNDRDTLNQEFSLLTNVIKIITGEDKIRFHHCRHSFCNWTWLRLQNNHLTGVDGIPFCQHNFFSAPLARNLCDRLSISPFSRKKLWALSGLLGHSSPDVTTSSYFHLRELVRRTRFAKHIPSPFLLRHLWGQHLNIDQNGRLISIPQAKHHLTDVYPSQYNPALITTSIEALIQSLELNPVIEFKKNITLKRVWEIICRLAERQTTRDIAYHTGLDENLILFIKQFDTDITQTTLQRSKYNLLPLANYDKLHRGNVKAIVTLIELFEHAEKYKLVPEDFNFATLNEILDG